MPTTNVLIAGCGYIGTALGVRLAAEGCTVWDLRRHLNGVGALYRLMRLAYPAPLYLGVDHHPVARGTLLHWLAARLGVPSPPEAEPDAMRQQARSNKRCRNARLVAAGYALRYRSFRAGYAALLAESEATA